MVSRHPNQFIENESVVLEIVRAKNWNVSILWNWERFIPTVGNSTKLLAKRIEWRDHPTFWNLAAQGCGAPVGGFEGGVAGVVIAGDDCADTAGNCDSFGFVFSMICPLNASIEPTM